MMLNSFKSLVKKYYRINRTKLIIKFFGPTMGKFSHWDARMFLLGTDALHLHLAEKGHYYRNVTLATLDDECVKDLAEIAGIVEDLLGDDFVSLYVTGGVAARNFTPGFSDLDLVIVTRDGYVSGKEVGLVDRLEAEYRQYTEMDISMITKSQAEAESTPWNIVLRMEGVCFAGRKLNVNAPVDRRNFTLWERHRSQKFDIKEINKFLIKDRIASRDVCKLLIRAVFECAHKKNPAYYSKDIILITNLANDHILGGTAGWFLGHMMMNLFRDYSMLAKGYDLDPDDKMYIAIHVWNAVKYINGERNEENFIYP